MYTCKYPYSVTINFMDTISKPVSKKKNVFIVILAMLENIVFGPVAWGFRIQPTFALVRIVRGD